MFQVIVKEIRPNTSVNFFQGVQDPLMDQSIKDYYFQNYIENGKFIAAEKNLSEDGLTLTKTMIWESSQARQDFINDQYLKETLHALRIKYNFDNNITQYAVSAFDI